MSSQISTVQKYISALPEERKDIIQTVHETLQRAVPDLAPHIAPGMKSPMIGYGNYHYKYASGREGDWPVIALANQKNYVSVYICAANEHGYLAENNKHRLGNVSVGRSCVRFKRIEDIKLDVLSEVVREAATLVGSGNFSM